MGDRDDEMARTATAPPSTSQPVKPAQPIGPTLGRYRLERELGEGGMGVVHAAFDPDLERRVAVKVLRTGDSSDARQRLLREARAMAKLAHPNVVVVHEVGSANGRDYVAMELVDGHNLAEWLRSERRGPDEIVEAFVAAGRGLAAAHAAGLVHRDFKPHNVLRSRDGRILVTDFGLARGVEVSEMALDTTMRPDQPTTSPLSGLTATGSVLGTPAYMAPEAWQGKPVGPSADQFGFCVGLWEALTGERPFKGDTIEELRKLVNQGASTLDLSKLPRRLRAPLTRGLDADPARRYPTMDALLADLAPKRRSRWPLAAGGVAIVAALGVFVATRGDRDHVLACPQPAIAWPDRPADALVGAGHRELANAIDRDVAAWRSIRDSACALTTVERAPELQCLDGMIVRADAIAKAAATINGPLGSDVLIEELVDPVVCTRPTPPRLHTVASADMVTAFGLLAQASLDTPKLAPRDAIAFADKQGIDPCARPLALAAGVRLLEEDKPQQRTVEGQRMTATAQCNDDRVQADALIDDAEFHFEIPRVGVAGHDAIRKAQAAVARIDQADLVAEMDMMKARAARDDANWKETFDAVNRALDGFGKRGDHRRQLAAVTRLLYSHLARGNADDPATVLAGVAKWKPIAIADHAGKIVDELERYEGGARFVTGDVAGAHAAVLRLWHPKHDDHVPSLAIDGVVVDHDGKPVPDATVACDDVVFIDSVGIVFPQGELANATLRSTKTDAAGKFSIPDAVVSGTLMAEHDDRRSRSALVGPHVRLVLEATRRLQGKVDLGTTSSTHVQVIARNLDVHADHAVYVAPVRTDGTFTIDRAPTSQLHLGAAVSDMIRQTVEYQVVPPSTAATTGLVLTLLKPGRSLDVIARSSVSVPLDNVQVLLFPGKVAAKTITELFDHAFAGIQFEFGQRVLGENASKAAMSKLRAGDLIAHFAAVRAGELTACAVALPGDLADRQTGNWIRNHRNELALNCATIAPTDEAIVVDTPPQKRFD